MLKVQKQSLVGDILTFNVFLDNGSVEPCVYKLVDETEDALMARVALHIESETAARDTVVPLEEIVVEPVKEVTVSEGKVSIKTITPEEVA